MLTYNPEFVENSEYAYAVARIRALETRLIDNAAFNSLLSTPWDRFSSLFTELTGISGSDALDPFSLLKSLEEAFTDTFQMVKALILEEEIKRLISLKYDYELMKLIIRRERGEVITVPDTFLNRASFLYPELKTMLGEGRALDTGPVMYSTYLSMIETKDVTGKGIDHACDHSYYTEVFQMIDIVKNDFIRNYFLRQVDAFNIVTALRLKLRGGKRQELRERFLPFGTINLLYLEDSLDLNLESFSQKIIFSPLSSVLVKVNKQLVEEDQVVQAERLFDEDLIEYLRESIFVTFGIEPVLAYLWMKEVELRNLRTILIARNAGVSVAEIKEHLRGLYG